MNSNDESTVKITIEGDATSVVAATAQASAGLKQLRADVAGLNEVTPPPMGLSQPPVPAPAAPAPAAPFPGPLPRLGPDLRRGDSVAPASPADISVPPDPVRTIAAEGDSFHPVAPRLPHLSTPPADPTGPVSFSFPEAAPVTPLDNLVSENVIVLSGKNPIGGVDQNSSRDPASPMPPLNNAVELQKLQELGRVMQDNSARLAQMFSSIIETQRSSLRLQVSQQAEINALNAQLRTLLAQVGNGRFNAQ